MGNSNNTRCTSVFLPCVDFGLLLIVIMFGTAGLGWLTTCPNIQADGRDRPNTTKEEISGELLDKCSIRDQLSLKLDAKSKEASEVEEQLEAAKAALPDFALLQSDRNDVMQLLEEFATEASRVRSSLQELGRKYWTSEKDRKRLEEEQKQLEQQLQELEAKLHELLKRQRDLDEEKDRIKRFQEEISRIEKQLEEANEANANLREQIARASKPVVPRSYLIEMTPRISDRGNRNAEFVLLNQGTVTPVRKPYYAITEHDNGLTIASLSYRGDNAAKSIANGSDFDKLLDNINRRSEYVFFVVDDESYETFRTVRAECQRRKIDCGWDPSNTVNFNFGSSGRSADPQ